MKEDYLWDKSGEPDPEIQELEEVLGSLRYQSKRLDLSDNNQQMSRRSYVPLVAIAATLVIAVLAGLFWLSHRHNQGQNLTTTTTAPVATPTSTIPEVKQTNEVRKSADTPPPQVAVATNRQRRTVTKTATPSKEAVLAKEQLMTALRLASEKLNLAQRKTQNPSVNQIRNQHKLG
jgi:hypothetical protein